MSDTPTHDTHPPITADAEAELDARLGVSIGGPGTASEHSLDTDPSSENGDPQTADDVSDSTHELDAGRLFQISRQIDRLRDDCRWLLRRHEGHDDVLIAATERYDHLAASLDPLLSEDERHALSSDMTQRRPGSLAELMLAAGQLAAWVDGLLLGPAFLVTHHAQSFNSSMLDAMRRNTTSDDTEMRTSPITPGAYL